MKTAWTIKDWAGNGPLEILGRKEFESYGDARDWISEYADRTCRNTLVGLNPGEDGYSDLYDGICEDLYAVNVDEEGNEIEDTGQYSY